MSQLNPQFGYTRLVAYNIIGFLLPGGHENFAKMIDEAEVLEFPMVVKNTRGHRGGSEIRGEGREYSEQSLRFCVVKE